MDKRTAIAAIIVALISFAGCTALPGNMGNASNTSIPYYFIAIHNEPFNVPSGEAGIADSYRTLERMVAKADQYNIELTLMFTAQWADYIAADPARLAEVQKWEAEGHEIAGHHHGLDHGNWDGYTNYTEAEALAHRENRTQHVEPYHGTLEDYIASLKKINPDIRSGCMNDEGDKRELPKEIIYDTCSGFANYGTVGTRADDVNVKKGINDFILSSTYDGIARKWLTHYQITTPERELDAQNIFSTLNSSEVYGAVTHSVNGTQEDEFYAYLDFIHSKDPTGARSRTLSEVIEQNLLPVKELSEAQLTAPPTAPTGLPGLNATGQQGGQRPGNQSLPGAGKCGDGVCGPAEQANPNLCPQDCANSSFPSNGTANQAPPNSKLCGDGICDQIEQQNHVCPQDCGNASARPPMPAINAVLFPNLTYSSVQSGAVKLDLYLPNKTCSGKFPLIINIHGGAFVAGDKEPLPLYAFLLADNCYAIASLDYRMSKEALFPAGNQDVKAAVRWLRAHADEYNLDAAHFGAIGGSAGGYYSAFLGTTGGVSDFDVGDNLNYSSSVQAVVDEFGIGNMSSLAQDRIDGGLKAETVESAYMGCDIGSLDCANAAKASPADYISADDPPFFILHGENDTQIPIKQSEDLYSELLGAGVNATFIPIPDAGHGDPKFNEYNRQVVQFFDKYLKG